MHIIFGYKKGKKKRKEKKKKVKTRKTEGASTYRQDANESTPVYTTKSRDSEQTSFCARYSEKSLKILKITKNSEKILKRF